MCFTAVPRQVDSLIKSVYVGPYMKVHSSPRGPIESCRRCASATPFHSSIFCILSKLFNFIFRTYCFRPSSSPLLYARFVLHHPGSCSQSVTSSYSTIHTIGDKHSFKLAAGLKPKAQHIGSRNVVWRAITEEEETFPPTSKVARYPSLDLVQLSGRYIPHSLYVDFIDLLFQKVFPAATAVAIQSSDHVCLS